MNHKLYFMWRKLCLPVISEALWQPSTTMAPHRSCLDRFSLVVSGCLHFLLCARCVAQPLNDAAVSCKQPHNHMPPVSFAITATKQPHMTEVFSLCCCLCWQGYVWFTIYYMIGKSIFTNMKMIRKHKPIFNEKDSSSRSYYGFMLAGNREVRLNL